MSQHRRERSTVGRRRGSLRYVPMATLVAILSSAVLPMAEAQDFDCAKARTASEQAICGSNVLRALDEQLGVTYGYARRFAKSEADERRLIASQRGWLKQRDRCGADTACLEASYRARIAELE